jgi:hypothetical protein
MQAVELLEDRVVPSLALGPGKGVLRFDDADGDRIAMRIFGPGSGQVTLTGNATNRADIESVVLQGTDQTTRLQIRVEHERALKGFIDIGPGGLGKLNLDGVLSAQLRSQGPIGTLRATSMAHASVSSAVRFGSITVPGRVVNSTMVAGLDSVDGTLCDGHDALGAGTIAQVVVRGSFIGSSIAAGVAPGLDCQFGTADDVAEELNDPSTIGVVRVGGRITAGDGGNHFAITAADAAPAVLRRGHGFQGTANMGVFGPVTSGPSDNQAPTIGASLAHDTGPSGGPVSDGITSDPTVAGTVADASSIASFFAGFGASPTFDVLNTLQTNGTFQLDAARLGQINGGSLPDGVHRLRLRATDAHGNTSPVFELSFVLDATAPLSPTFDLAIASDTPPLGDHETIESVVTLQGTTALAMNIELRSGQTLVATGVSDSVTGAFGLSGVPLALGGQAFTVRATDTAGNASEFSRTIARVAGVQQVDPVLEWNRVALEAIRLDATAPPVATRTLAMVHAAIYDVVNAIDGTPGFYVAETAPSDASLDAAVAVAAERVLAYAYPAQRSSLSNTLTASLARVPDGPAESHGIELGGSIGDSIIAMRYFDGWDDFATYPGGEAPGLWRPTEPMFEVALLPQWASLDPFTMTSPSQFRPPGPPALDSQAYATSLNDVKALGRQTGSSRTPEQTAIARFWADGPGTYTPPGHWNLIAEEIAARGTSPIENARLFAQLNLALADAAIVAWNAKYTDGFWRPITAIQEAESDGNPATSADESWQPFLISPPFPDYVSGHSTFSAAAATILGATFGDATPFTTRSVGLPGVDRTFPSFSAAAAEAGRSRVYAGIHFEFANQDGQAAGRQVADWVLQAFDATNDTRAPSVIVTSPTQIDVVREAFNVAGRVIDNSSGVRSLTSQLDDGVPVNITFDATGQFSIPIELADDGTADGSHTLRLEARDVAGNAAAPTLLQFTLDTRTPTIALASPGPDDDLITSAILIGSVDGTGSAVTALSYRVDGGVSSPVTFSAATSGFSGSIDASGLAPGSHTLELKAIDAAGNVVTLSRSVALSARVPFRIAEVTPSGGARDVGVTYRPQVTFTRPVNTSSLNALNLFATGPTGEPIAATIVPASDGSFAWLFFADPLPGGASVTLQIDGSTIHALGDGLALDADGDGTPGGIAQAMFTTVSVAPLIGASLIGRVIDPGRDLKPMTFDDIRPGPDGTLHTSDDVFLNPIAGARVFILGRENEVVTTDSAGRFHFDAVPVGDVKVVIDGRTATNAPAGFYFPEMVMDVTFQAGRVNTFMGSMGSREEMAANANRDEVYLPRIRSDIFQDVSGNAPTTIGVIPTAAPSLTDEERARLTITVPSGSLIGHDGQPLASGQVGISLVPPELVRDMLPPGVMQHTFDITVQAPGIDRFSTPAPMTFPNVSDAPPGTQLNFISFDHTTGRLVIEGTATVSADGLTVTTDPGTGITHPGWHGTVPPGGPAEPCRPEEYDIDVDPVVVTDGLQNYFFKDDAGSFTLHFRNDARPPVPILDPCDGPNNRATPLVVEMRVDGDPDGFLTGLASQTIALLPGQDADIDVNVDDFLPRVVKIERDQMWGVGVEVTAYKFGDPGAELLHKQIYVYRFVDAADAAQPEFAADGVVEIPDTLVDGHQGITRTRPVDYFAPDEVRPEIVVESIHFLTDDAGGFVFDPVNVAEDLSATARIQTPDGDVVGSLRLQGDGTPKLKLDINKSQLVSTLASVVLDAATPGGNVNPVLFTEAERSVLATDALRSAFADDLAAAMSAAFINVKAGIELGAGANSIIVNWTTNPNSTSYGDSSIPAPADGVDLGDINGLLASLSKHSNTVQNFLVSELMNRSLQTNVTVYTENPIESFAGGFLNLTREQMISALRKTTVHEAGHTLGLIHTAQVTGSNITSELQRITLTNAVLGDTFTLTFNGATTVPIRFDADGAFLLGVLEALPTVGIGNLSVSGAQGGPYEIEFVNDLAGLEVPAITGTGTRALTVTTTTVTPGSTILTGVAVPSGGTDLMYGGRVDSLGSLEFRPGLSQDGLKVALRLDWTPEEAQNVILFWVHALLANNGKFFDGLPGGEETRLTDVPYGAPGLFLFDDDALVFRALDFGTVTADGVGTQRSTHTLRFRNIGSEPVELNSVTIQSLTGAFSSDPVVPGTVIEPGGEFPVAISFDPGMSGEHTGFISIATNDPAAPSRVDLTGFGRSMDGDLRVEVSNNNIGGVKVGAGAVLRADAVTLHNVGANVLVITDVRIVAGDGELNVQGLPAGLSSTSPIEIAPGESFSFDVSFDPGAIGLRRAAIELVSNDPDMAVFRQPFVGTGLADAGTGLDFGDDFVALETPFLQGSPVLRQRTDDAGNWTFFLPPQEAIHFAIFDPISGLIGQSYDVTAPSGQSTPLSAPVFLASTSNDGDGDGLPDDVEFAIGTSANRVDSDGDGISDFAEIELGEDPIGGLSTTVGVAAAVRLSGESNEVVIEGAIADPTELLAYVASGTSGLAIVDVTQPTAPVLLGEIDLQGTSTDVDVDTTRGLAAVAAGTALHIVDVSNASQPQFVASIPLLNINRVEVLDGLAIVGFGNSLVSIDLVTHQRRQTLDLGTFPITDIVTEGSTIYTMDPGRNLHTITLDNLVMTPRASLAVPDGGGRLFVTDGIVYAIKPTPGSSFSTIDVRDVDAPFVISNSDALREQLPNRAVAVNGSGLAVLVGNPTVDITGVRQNVLDVLSLADLSNTAAFVTRVPLPALPESVALATGFAFVADGSSDLQIVRFVAPDVEGEPPTAAISADPPDADPNSPGIQVLERRSFAITTQVADDVQVRRVELLVNGAVVDVDAAAPWSFLVTPPLVSEAGDSVSVQVRASDTGGNTALSNLLVYHVVDDVTPPSLVHTTPNDGDQLSEVTGIELSFDEGLDSSLFNASGISLIALGPNGVAGGGDDTPVQLATVSMHDEARIISIETIESLAPGAYRLTVPAAILADLAGNHVLDAVQLGFEVVRAHPIRAATGVPTDLELASLNPGQEVQFVLPWDPDAGRIRFTLIDHLGVEFPNSIDEHPFRTDPATRTAWFLVPPNAVTHDVTVLAGGIFDIRDLPNWTITRGSVDLFGNGFYKGFPRPANGLYLNMDGDGAGLGRIESKERFELTPGDYELSFSLGGPHFQSDDKVTVSLGDLFSEAFSLTAQDQTPHTFTRTISVSSSTSVRLAFDDAAPLAGVGDGYGMRLDDVILKRTDSGALLMEDHFELPVPDATFPLQIVPVVTGVDVTFVTANAMDVTLFGGGFVEGNSTVYRLGTETLVDSSVSDGPDVTDFETPGARSRLTVPITTAAFGAISVTTAGGTSAPFTVDIQQVTGTAMTGTPADPALPSANPGQAVTVTGTGLSVATDFIVEYRDSVGGLRNSLLNPVFARIDGTEAQLVIPDYHNGVSPVRTLGSSFATPLQIVPRLDRADVTDVACVQLTGRGFLEGTGTYAFPQGDVVDINVGLGPDVTGFGPESSVADVPFPITGFGALAVTTPGGTSRPIPWDAVTPSFGPLFDVAVDPTSGELFVATGTSGADGTTIHIDRLDPATGRSAVDFDLPLLTGMPRVGLDLIREPVVVAGVTAPAGSLLAVVGVVSGNGIPAANSGGCATLLPVAASIPSRTEIFAINLDPAAGAVGDVIGSLTLPNIAATAAIIDPTNGNLILLDGDHDDFIRLRADTGAVLQTHHLPISIDSDTGGLALDPETANLWVGSRAGSDIAEVGGATGAVLRRVGLAPQGISSEISGLAFDAAGNLVASSIYGVVVRLKLDTPEPAPPSISGINALAPDGNPADTAIASANAGQVITIQGANLRPTDLQIIFPTRDEFGIDGITAAAPLAVNEAGTAAQVRVPMLAATGQVRVAKVGADNLGFGAAADAIHRDVTVSFTPTETTATLRFSDGGIGFDESWGIDNVRVERGGVTLFADDFEQGAQPQWAIASTDTSLPGIFTRFSGRFANATQTLTLAGLVPGASHTLHLDLYAIDSWDGLDATDGPDRFIVTADSRPIFDQALSNRQDAVQTLITSSGVPLQIVPTIAFGKSTSALTEATFLRPGGASPAAFSITGSGFMDGASQISIGGVVIVDHIPESRLDPNQTDVTDAYIFDDSSNSRYFVSPLALTLEGPVRITTAGGWYEVPRFPILPHPSATLTGIQSVARRGTPANPALPSANTGQNISLIGAGMFSEAGFATFEAVDDTGVVGTISREGSFDDRLGRVMGIQVPALARTGLVRAHGAPGGIVLQVVPTINSVSPLVPGQQAMLDGTGLPEGDVTITIDGQVVTQPDVQAVLEPRKFHTEFELNERDQQFIIFTVPAGITAGVVTVATSGGSDTVRAGFVPTILPNVSPAADVGDTSATALAIDLPTGTRLTIDSSLDPTVLPPPVGWPFPFPPPHVEQADIDAYSVSLAAGERVIVSFEVQPDHETGFATISGPNGIPDLIDYPVDEDGNIRRFEFVVPGDGTYFVTVNPFGNSSDFGDGPYRLRFERVPRDASTLRDITAAAASGTAAQPGVPSANVGQRITIRGTGLSVADPVVFTSSEPDDLLVAPVAAAPDGSSIDVIVPERAITGGVRLAGESHGVFLQIVPTLTSLEIDQFEFTHLGTVLFGAGLEAPVTVHLGNVDLIDHRRESTASFMFGVRFTTDFVPLGPVSVTTGGGTSAVLDSIALDDVIAVATSGTPADAAQPSANPGQTITLRGHGFTSETGIVFWIMNQDGFARRWVSRPTTVNGAGTELTVKVPGDAVTGEMGIMGERTGRTVLLQIVPTVQSADVTAIGTLEITGTGLIEGNNTIYHVGSGFAIDATTSTSAGIQVTGFNQKATMPLLVGGAGSLSVQTAGGTSAPIPWNVVNPGVGPLTDVAYDPGSATMFAATRTEIHRIDPASGRVLVSFPIPAATFIASASIQLLTFSAPGLTLGSSSLPIGSQVLLVFVSTSSDDQVLALDPADGSVLASVTLAPGIDPVAGVFHAVSGHLFVLDAFPDRVVEIDPANGNEIASFPTPTAFVFGGQFDVLEGGLAVDPTDGNLWIASNRETRIAELTTAGVLVQSIDIVPDGIGNEMTGVAFETGSNVTPQFLVASSERGVIYLHVDPPSLSAALIDDLLLAMDGGLVDLLECPFTESIG